jgi:hypothetical protein
VAFVGLWHDAAMREGPASARARARLPTVASFALVLGCGAVEVGDRAASDFACPHDDVTVDRVGTSGYVATGCGWRATYVCEDMTCIRNSDMVRLRDDPRDLGAGFEAQWGESIEACAGRVAIRIEFDGDGSIASIPAWEGETEHARRCVARLLARAELRPVPGSRTTLTIDRTGQAAPPSEPASQATSSPPASASSAGPASPSVAAHDEQRVREILDALRDDILACVEQDRVLVRLQWSGGQPHIELGGALRSSPAEGCVRDVVGERLTGVVSSSGGVVHLVRAAD